MGDNLTAVFLASSDHLIDGTVAIIVSVGPVWLILHYVAKMRANRQHNALDAAALEAVLATTQRLEQRVKDLELILDSELPDWRNQPANTYQRAS